MNDSLTSKKSSSIVPTATSYNPSIICYIRRIKSITRIFCGSYTHIYLYLYSLTCISIHVTYAVLGFADQATEGKVLVVLPLSIFLFFFCRHTNPTHRQITRFILVSNTQDFDSDAVSQSINTLCDICNKPSCILDSITITTKSRTMLHIYIYYS